MAVSPEAAYYEFLDFLVPIKSLAVGSRSQRCDIGSREDAGEVGEDVGVMLRLPWVALAMMSPTDHDGQSCPAPC